MADEKQSLLVYLNDLEMGRLDRQKGGKLTFYYSSDYLGDPHAVPLSLSMPLDDRVFGHETISPWLWGLLPDNEFILARWAKRFQVSAANCFGLLQGMGEDCAGAVRFILPERRDFIGDGGLEPLDEHDIERRLDELRQNPSIGRDPQDRGQFSLAGAQSKTALQWRDGQWYVPWGREPTTHIFKPPRSDIEGHAENEHFCLRLAEQLGLVVARSEILRFGNVTAIAIERYDRVMQSGHLVRVHQEDVCQALGIHPAMKYQNEGGPDVISTMELMNRSSQPFEDRRSVMEAIVFNYLILGTDAHAKNFSLLLGRNQQVRLCRLYDLASFLPYAARLKDCRFAMKIGGYYLDNQIHPRHFERMARACEFPAQQLMSMVAEMAERLPNAADRVRKDMANDGIFHGILDRLVTLLTERSFEKAQIFRAAI